MKMTKVMALVISARVTRSSNIDKIKISAPINRVAIAGVCVFGWTKPKTEKKYF